MDNITKALRGFMDKRGKTEFPTETDIKDLRELQIIIEDTILYKDSNGKSSDKLKVKYYNANNLRNAILDIEEKIIESNVAKYMSALAYYGVEVNNGTEVKLQKSVGADDIYNNIEVVDSTEDEIEELEQGEVEEETDTSEASEITESTEEPDDYELENIDIDDIQEEFGDSMTYEEMLVKGLSGIIENSQNKNSTIDISDDTIQKIKDIFSVEKERQYEWIGASNTPKSDYSKNVFGYDFNDCKSKLELKKALLLMGVPGTGKTTILTNLINDLTDGDKDRYKIISFSQDTDYSDFIGGLTSEQGVWTYKHGILTEMCMRADSDRDNKYYLGIDEMSRGNTEAIFGELMTGIEHRDTIIYVRNGDKLMIPSNLYIIGTMNTSDTSTKRLDKATLERFTRYTIKPQWTKEYMEWISKSVEVTKETMEKLTKLSEYMVKINNEIENDKVLGEECIIGTRSISGIELTDETFKIAIKNRLIPDLKKIQERASERYQIDAYIDKIYKLIE